MKKFLKHIGDFICEEKLFQPHNKVLVAVSGGVDSMVLADVLLTLGYDISLAHCNFGLRGEDSDLDQSLVEQYAKLKNCQFHVSRFDTVAFAQKQQISIQMAARQLRYEWFHQLCDEHGYDYVVTAHHQNDQLETVLFNLSKGTGIAGLRGILPINDKIRRPLLTTSKESIVNYAKEMNLIWREDVSNSSNKYARNKIRNEVVPCLETINPKLLNTTTKTIKRMRALEKLLIHRSEEIKSRHFRDQLGYGELEMSWFSEESGGMAILEYLLKPYGFAHDQCQNIADAYVNRMSGGQFFSRGNVLVVDRNKLIITQGMEEIGEIEVNEDTSRVIFGDYLLKFKRREFDGGFSQNVNTAYLCMCEVTFPLRLRTYKQGDRFIPLGMKRRKKLSDFFIDEKIPLNLKKRIPLLISGNEIAWVCGHRISDQFKTQTRTVEVMVVEMEKNRD